MVNIGTKNLHYLVKHKSSRSHRSWLETLQFFTAELPRAQARVSTVQANWIQTRSQGRESGDWTMTGQLIHKSYSQSSHLPTARCMSGNEVENTWKSSQIFFPVVFPVCQWVNESLVSGFINQWGTGNIFSDNFDQSWTWPLISETYLGIRQATNNKIL